MQAMGLALLLVKLTANDLPVANAMISYEGIKLPASRSKADGTYKTLRQCSNRSYSYQISAPGFKKYFNGKVIIKDAEDILHDECGAGK